VFLFFVNLKFAFVACVAHAFYFSERERERRE